VTPVAHQQSGFDHRARRKAREYPLAHCQRGDLRGAADEEAIAHDEKRLNAFDDVAHVAY
jgi:hypothetical protein